MTPCPATAVTLDSVASHAPAECQLVNTVVVPLTVIAGPPNINPLPAWPAVTSPSKHALMESALAAFGAVGELGTTFHTARSPGFRVTLCVKSLTVDCPA